MDEHNYWQRQCRSNEGKVYSTASRRHEVTEINKTDEYTSLHVKFYENYQKGNFTFCEQALEHLVGKWGGEIDSYYQIMSDRISKYKQQDNKDWDPILYK
jgi:hypothetical protein